MNPHPLRLLNHQSIPMIHSQPIGRRDHTRLSLFTLFQTHLRGAAIDRGQHNGEKGIPSVLMSHNMKEGLLDRHADHTKGNREGSPTARVNIRKMDP